MGITSHKRKFQIKLMRVLCHLQMLKQGTSEMGNTGLNPDLERERIDS